jgi:ribonuclease P protein component
VFEEAMREEDVPAQQPEAEEEARLPAPHAQSRRASGHPASPVEGPRPPLRLIWRVSDRASFRALARSRRHRRGVLVVSSVTIGLPDVPPRVAYTVDRHVGGAVVRNRVRRRLRAAVHEAAGLLEPGHTYMIRASRQAAVTSYRELSSTLRAILADMSPS